MFSTANGNDGITDSARNWYLNFSETWHTMSQVLGLKRLQKIIQGSCNLSDEPVWLLGVWYGLHNQDSMKSNMSQEVQELMLQDFHSRFWFTYRRDFSPIGTSGLISDVGWGCTLRSGQMLMAEALARCWWGRNQPSAAQTGAAAAAGDHSSTAEVTSVAAGAEEHYSTTAATAAAPAGNTVVVHADEQQLLSLFQDQPGSLSPFSIHNLCTAGAGHGVVAGQWLGPWVLCKALAAAAATQRAWQQQQQQQQQQHGQQQRSLGLHVHVVCDPGGGAPTLQPVRLKALLTAQGACAQQAADCHCIDGSHSSSHPVQRAPADIAWPSQQPQQQHSHGPHQQGLLLLVPLTLGVGKVNERYMPQLTAVLTFPQSVGIVGGRPGSSLYFVGVQGSAVLYLDPHEVQQVAALPGDVDTFHCSTLRLMPLSAIDPSLAIGFYCKDEDDVDDLVKRLQQLMVDARGAPLMTVDVDGSGSARQQADAGDTEAVGGGSHPSKPSEQGGSEDWELV